MAPRIHRTAWIVFTLTLLACFAASAQVPYPPLCSMSSPYLTLRGSANGIPDRGSLPGRPGEWYFDVRDLMNNPIEGVDVTLDFSQCGDIQLSCDQLTAETGQQRFDKRVVAFTNAVGRATFYVLGAANSATTIAPVFLSPGTNAGVPCAAVSIMGMPLGSVIVSAWDVDGKGSMSLAAVNAADVAKVMAEALINQVGTRARSDMNYDNMVNAADVGFLAAIVLSRGALNRITAPYCP